MYCRHLLKSIFAVVFPSIFLGACSFQPLYGKKLGGMDVATELSSIEIDPIPGRVGQKLRNELIFKTTRGAQPSSPSYRLEIGVRESVLGVNIERSGDASGKIYALDADFKLVRLGTNKVAMKGRSRARAAYDQFNSNLSNIRARIDAENRSARIVADDIKTRLAAFLSSAT